MKAIAAMSLNRVIGRDNTIPWHLPEDFRWFKRATMGQAIVMGRTTFESLGKPLPGRRNCVLSRTLPPSEGIHIARDLAELGDLTDAWLIGGASLYAQFLPECTDLYLSVVQREVEGDTFFPPFEHLFEPDYVVELITDDFEVRHYRRKNERACSVE